MSSFFSNDRSLAPAFLGVLLTTSAVFCTRAGLPDSEPPGPSSRRTALTISEVHYHPSELADGVDIRFVELYNSQPIDADLSGFRLAGDVDYTFPEGTTLEGLSFLVVASDVPAFNVAYPGTGDVHGPWGGELGRDSGTIRLMHRLGAILLEVDYETVAPWPVAADGFGHSMVLARPSYGENDSYAWQRSQNFGGSPGSWDVPLPDSFDHLVINEFLANSEDPTVDFIELHNVSAEAIDIGGVTMGDTPGEPGFAFPAGTMIDGGGKVVVTETELGFALSSKGDEIVVRRPDGRVIDIFRFGPTATGVTTGRYPDGGKRWQELSAPSAGETNTSPLVRHVVINEIMYHPLSNDDDDEFIELFNIGEVEVDLGGWRLIDGIEFTIPNGTILAPSGCLVIARNAERLRGHYDYLDDTNCIGDYSGRLSNSGERIALAMPENAEDPENSFVVVDEVTYLDGGRWGEWSDGGGSSLELRDPRSDNRMASNWADSDESDKADWTMIDHTGLLELGHPSGQGNPNELHLMLLGAGEVILDDVEVIQAGGPNRFPGGTFESGNSLEDAFIRGNHVNSTRIRGGYESAFGFRLDASGGGDNGANCIKVPLTSTMSQGAEGTIRAKARWLRGHPDLLLRLRGSWLEVSQTLDVPANLGSPGQANSTWIANSGPAVYDVVHHPVLPAFQEEVVVTARVLDVDGVGDVMLNYRVDPSEDYESVTMNDEGRDGDRFEGDGVYSGIIPGQNVSTLIGFHVEAYDASDFPARATFPERVFTEDALIRWGESHEDRSFGTYHMWVANEWVDVWSSREPLSNEAVNGTFVYGDFRPIYGFKVRFRGSPFIRRGFGSPVSGQTTAYVFETPKDDLLLGTDEFNLDELEQRSNRDSSFMRERLSFWLAEQLGVSFSYQRYVHIYVNGNRRGEIYADVQHSSSDYYQSWYPGQSDGEIFKIDDWFEFSDNFGFSNINATLQDFTNSDGEKPRARYRWSWEKKSNGGLDDNYDSLFKLVDALNQTGPYYTDAVESVVDVDQWIRVIAIRHLVGDWDGYGYNRGKNMLAYKPRNGKWKLVLWDLDFSLGGGSDGPTTSVFNINDFVISRFLNTPKFLRKYVNVFKEAVEGPFGDAGMAPVIADLGSALSSNSVSASGARDIRVWVGQRSSYLRSFVDGFDGDFAVNGPTVPIQSTASVHQISGNAPLGLADIRINGQPARINWLSSTAWQIDLPLMQGENRFEITGVDAMGDSIEGMTGEVVVNYTGEGQADSASGSLVISELMYNPLVPGTEYVEVYNRSDSTVFDLGAFDFRGLGGGIPVGNLIAPSSRVVLVNDPVQSLISFGQIPIGGIFEGRLNDGGERIEIVGRNPADGSEYFVDRVEFEDLLPWPTHADGAGSSLQLISTDADNSRVSNWFASDLVPGADPVWKFVSVTGVATGDALTVFHSPYEPVEQLEAPEGAWEGVINYGTFDGQEVTLPIRVEFNQQPGDDWEVLLYPDGSTEAIVMEPTNIAPPTVRFGLDFGDGMLDFRGRLSADENTISGPFFEIFEGGSNRYGFTISRTSSTGGARELFVDDVQLVAGTEPGVGANLVVNGDFELETLDGWSVGSTHGDSESSTEQANMGGRSLRLVSTFGGEGLDTSVSQSVAVQSGETYTLSFWYLSSRSAVDLTVGLDDGSLTTSFYAGVDEPFSPGRANISNAEAPLLPDFWINEVFPDVGGGAWLELFNSGGETIDLDGYHLSDDPADLSKWAFPSGASIGSGAFRLAMLDGIPELTTVDEWHTGFTLAESSGVLLLSRQDVGGTVVVDYRRFSEILDGASFGLYPDGAHLDRRLFTIPTPGESNVMGGELPRIVINEWMASNAVAVLDPADNDYEDWFELLNLGAESVDLGGFSLTDDVDDPRKYVIPAGWSIEAGGILPVWADGEPDQTSAENGLHADFRLSGDGEIIALFAPSGVLVDMVEFGAQTPDVSQGRDPDGADEPFVFFDVPTFGSSNSGVVERPLIDPVTVAFSAESGLGFDLMKRPGFLFRILFKENLDDVEWTLVEEVVGGEGSQRLNYLPDPGHLSGFIMVEQIPVD